VPPAEKPTAGRAAHAIDADRTPNPLCVELLFETHHASRLEIPAKQRPHDLGMIIDDVQGAILDPVAQRDYAALHIPFFFEATIFIPDPFPRNLPLELGK
jgi:hypothetical protein